MATLYGNSTGSGYWRLEIDYTVTDYGSYYNFSLAAYRYALKADTSGYDATKDTTYLQASPYSGSGKPTWNHANSKGQRRHLWSWAANVWKGTAAQTVTFGGSNTHPSGTMGGTSSIYGYYTVPALVAYSITYSNGGDSTITNMPANGVRYQYNNYTIAAAPTKANYTFLYWRGSNGVNYAPGSTYNGDAALTLTAIFRKSTYTVKFISNIEGATDNQTQSFNVGESQNLTSNPYTYRNYLLYGWGTSPGGAKVYDNGQSVTNLSTTDGATVNLYAIWVEQYTTPILQDPNAERAVLKQSGGTYEEDPFGEKAILSVYVIPGQKRTSATSALANMNTRVYAYYSDLNGNEYLVSPSSGSTNYYTISQASTLQWIISTNLPVDNQYSVKFIAQTWDNNDKKFEEIQLSIIHVGAFLLDASPEDDSIGIFTSAPDINKAVLIGLDGDIWLELDDHSSGTIDAQIINGIDTNYWDVGNENN